jgi:hypothetical protein
LALGDLQFDTYSSYWRDVVQVVHAHEGYGQDDVIAIIDSGFRADGCGDCPVDLARSLDLTGDGLADTAGHGTALSVLIHAIAPRAVQYHVKVFHADGRMASGGYEQEVAQIERAFRHVEDNGATIVNVSWNMRTGRHRFAPSDVRPGSYCACPACAVVTGYVQRADADVFVSEGNFQMGDTGDWSCPAAALLVVPVVGQIDGVEPYDTNLDPTNGVLAPAHVRVAAKRGRTTTSLSGSSFAAPLVAATHAAVKSAFRDRGYDAFQLPRNWEEGERASTSYNWPLELFFSPPDVASVAEREKHTYWYVLDLNCENAARRLAAAGQPGRAGALCGMLGDIMMVAYRRMAAWPYRIDIGGMILTRYLQAIELLHRSPSARMAARYFAPAREALAVRTARGTPAPDAHEMLAQLEQAHWNAFKG